MSTKNNEIKPIEYSCNGKMLTFDKPQIMAIINITPDSFYDGGKYSSADDVLKDAENKINEGARIIDLGAASSRPNASEVNAEDEWRRLGHILPVIRKHFPQIFISVDTFHSSVAIKSAEAGADIINDVSGGSIDEKMFETIVRLNLPYILMHLEGTPQTMQKNAPYADVVGSVKNYFIEKTEKLSKSGFSKIILDPGFGFGKSLENNYELLKNLKDLSLSRYPLLAGVSRKSMISKVIGSNPVTALNGTTVLHTIALLNGASILRVHDVKEARQAIELVSFYKNV
jgi:dihydropteroate synthase